MATGVDNHSLHAYGVFGATDHEPRIELLSPEVATTLKTKDFSPGVFSRPEMPFSDFDQRHIYSLHGRLDHLYFANGHFRAIPIPQEVTTETIPTVAALFFDLNAIFNHATDNYKLAIANNDDNLMEHFEAYHQAKARLLALIQKYGSSELIQRNDYFQTSFSYITTQATEENLFELPRPINLDDLVGGDKAKAALDNYLAVKNYFRNQGQFASEPFKSLHMSAVVYRLHESISELASQTDKQAFFHTHMNHAGLLSGFQADQVKYLKRFTQDEFNNLAMKYLFNMDQREPSEELRRRAALDPSQRAALHTWVERKHAALAQGSIADWYKLPTRFLSDAVWTAVDLVDRIQLGDRKTVDEIILEGFRISQNSWFTSRSLGNFYDEKDAELLLLTRQEESSPQAIHTRKVAQRELAKRTLDAARVAWDKHRPEFGERNIPGLLDVAEHAQTREGSLLALRNIYAALEDDRDGIFGRLDLIARINLDLYPSMASKHLPLTDEGIMYNAYTELQTLIKGELGQRSLTDALKHAIEIVGQAIPGLTSNEQIAIQLDDYRFLLQFIPVYESIIRFGAREATSVREHPNLDRALGFGGLAGIKSSLKAKIAELERQESAVIAAITAPAVPAAVPGIITTRTLETRLEVLLNKAKALPDSFEKDALIELLEAQLENAQRVFKSAIEPNAARRRDYFNAINTSLDQISDLITALNTVIPLRNDVSTDESALARAKKETTYKLRTDPAITAAAAALEAAETNLRTAFSRLTTDQKELLQQAERDAEQPFADLTLPAAINKYEHNL